MAPLPAFVLGVLALSQTKLTTTVAGALSITRQALRPGLKP